MDAFDAPFHVNLALNHHKLDATKLACGSPFIGVNTAILDSDLYANCYTVYNYNNYSYCNDNSVYHILTVML